MRFRNLIFLAVLVAALAGCKSADTTAAPDAAATPPVKADATAPSADASANDLKGTWESADAAKEGATSTFGFNPDNTYSMVVEAKAAGKDVKTDVGGTYKLEGEKITLHMTSMKMTSTDADMQKAFDKTNSGAVEALKTMPELPGKLEWKDKDNVVMHMDAAGGQAAQSYALKRKA